MRSFLLGQCPIGTGFGDEAYESKPHLESRAHLRTQRMNSPLAIELSIPHMNSATTAQRLHHAGLPYTRLFTRQEGATINNQHYLCIGDPTW